MKKKTTTKKAKRTGGVIPKLELVEIKEQEQQNSQAISWGKKNTPFVKGFMIGGYILETRKIKNSFGNDSVLHKMEVAECSNKKFASSGDVVSMFEPAALRKLLSKVDTDGYVRIKYLGKQDDEHHFNLEAQTVSSD